MAKEVSEKQIFFHVGLSKTASTYLQERVFPLFKGMEYIHRMYRYNKVFDIILNTESDKILISREFDMQFERELKRFAPKYPNIQVFVVFRRQDGWIASQYRRYFKNGHIIPFSTFFDLKEDKGLFKKNNLDFMNYIRIVEKYFTKKPIVLLYDDLRKDPIAFFDYIAKQMDVQYDKKRVNLNTKHKSYSEKQLKALAKVAKIISVRKDHIQNPIIYPIRRLYTNIIRYSTLYIAKFLPYKWFGKEPLIDSDELKAVKDYFSDNWQAVLDYAKKNNPK